MMPVGLSELLIVAVLVGAVAMLALLARPRAEGSYRALQLAGWTLYGVAKYLAAKPATTVPRVALIVIIGFGISLAINAGIDRLFARGVVVPRIIGMTIAVIPIAAYVWLVRGEQRAQLAAREALVVDDQRLPERPFVRIHRSALVNLKHVERVEKWFNSSFRVHVRSRAEPLVSSRRCSAVLRALVH